MVIPVSVTRWLSFVHPEAMTLFSTFFGVSIYYLSGIFNVALLLSTRPQMELFKWTRIEDSFHDSGEEGHKETPQRTRGVERLSIAKDSEDGQKICMSEQISGQGKVE